MSGSSAVLEDGGGFETSPGGTGRGTPFANLGTAWHRAHERGTAALEQARLRAQEHSALALEQARQSAVWQRAQEHGAAALEHSAAALEHARQTAAWQRAQEHGNVVMEHGNLVLEQARSNAAFQKGTEALIQARRRVQEGHYTNIGNVKELIKHVDLTNLREAGFAATGIDLEHRKKEAMLAFFRLTKRAQAQVLLTLREGIKEAAIADPDMPLCVQRQITHTIDSFWADLMVCVELALEDKKMAVTTGDISDHQLLAGLGEDQAPCVMSPRWIRAKVLYHFLPFDVSIFGQMKDPFFWIMTILSVFPYYGIRVTFFLLLLVFIILGLPPDEYQLVTYILTFKGTQFLSSGILQAIVAAVRYYACVHPNGTHSCSESGPGQTQNLLSGLVDFLGSCMLTWAAFLLLPLSQRVAGTRGINAEADNSNNQEPLGPDEQRCCRYRLDRTKGGRISHLLCYDLCCFSLSIALFLGLASVKEPTASVAGQPAEALPPDQELLRNLETWDFGTEFFFARLVYSLLSVPFLFFYLPVLNSILTHTSPTGYNEQGLCVPYMLKPKPPKQE